ncbi:MAG: cysteine--tRNA ligase [Planctomycetaceae bacterium]|nr:cysteine--tRNA ligase [Planctomycetaceae bacterium]
MNDYITNTKLINEYYQQSLRKIKLTTAENMFHFDVYIYLTIIPLFIFHTTMIRVYNTLSKTKEEFKTVKPDEVGIYLCGPTVYKPSHIGHMVGPVIFDTIKRYLSYNGYRVNLVINITDVDDKLIAEANARKIPMVAVAEEMTADYMRNLDTMNVKNSVNHFPKVSENIDNIIKFTQDLIDKGVAYESEGDVYFNVSRFSEYGKLSHRLLEQMTGEGGGMANRKQTPFDFALWKSAKPDEPSWDSPWGKGRPGWHIECSVMSRELLGETFDIHGGGLDLVFPHHENEIAQSEARHEKPMCHFWMHNGLMQASSEIGKVGGRKTRTAEEGNIESQETDKISKSKGASAFRDMLKQFEPETIRFFLLSSHYRRPIDFSFERIEEVGKGLETFYRFTKRFEKITGHDFYYLAAAVNRTEGDQAIDKATLSVPELAEYRTKFLESMDDDFNTGAAIGVLFDLLRVLNKYIDDHKLETESESLNNYQTPLIHGATVLRELGLTLGLFHHPPKEKTNAGSDELVHKLMGLLLELRAAARKNKDFATADKIRKDLAEFGITLEDRPEGTEWKI